MVRQLPSCEAPYKLSLTEPYLCDAARTLVEVRRSRSQILAGFLVGILAWCGSARAQSAPTLAPAPLSNWLSVSREPGTERCPDRERLAAAVRSRLTGGSAPSSDELSAKVTLSAADRGLLLARVELRHRGQPIGARQLASHDASCDELARALAIVVALAIDVQFAGQSDSGALPPPRQRADEAADDAAADDAAAGDAAADEFLPLPADPNTQRRADLGLRFGGELTFGLMPHPQAGVGVALAQRVGSLVELDVGLSAFPWSVSSSLPKQRAEIDYRAALGQALVCVPVAASFWARAALCAGVSGGAVHTVSRGLGAASPTVSPLVNGVLSATLRFRLERRWLAFFSAGMGLAWLRKEFVFSALDGTTPTAYRMPPQFGSFGIGFEYEPGIRPSGSQSQRGRAIHF